MSTLSIQYFRKIRNVSVSINKATLIAGTNQQGKSSIALAAGLALTGNTVPESLAKKDSDILVNDQSKTGLIKLESEQGTTTIEYPSLKVQSTGTPLHSSPVAVGFVTPLTMSIKERAAFFGDLLKTDPTKEELSKQLPGSQEELDQIWSDITASGWDAVYNGYKTMGTEQKGAWEHVTGTKYGISKAETYHPDGWTPEHDRMTVSQLNERADQLIKERDKSIKSAAIGERIDDEIRDYAKNYDTAKANLDAAQKYYDKASKALSDLRASTPSVLVDNTMPCPECNAPLMVKNGKIVKGGAVSPEDIATSKKAVEEHNKKMKSAEKDVTKAQETLFANRALYNECKTAKDKIANSSTFPLPEGRPVSDIDADIAKVRADKKIIETMAEAHDIHEKIKHIVDIVTVLSPDGVRAEALKRSLKKFNTILSELCAIAKYPLVELHEDLSIWYDGKDYTWHIIDSGYYRVKAILQIAIAQIDESDILVFDGADILDKAGRNGIMRLLKDRPSLICMTMIDKKDMPDLSKVGGNSYWVEEGEIA